MVVETTVTYRLEGSEVETLTARLRGLVILRQLQERKLQEESSDDRSDEPVVRLRTPGSDRWSTAQLYRPVVPEDDQQNQQDAARKFLRSPIEPPSAARAQGTCRSFATTSRPTTPTTRAPRTVLGSEVLQPQT